MGVFTRLEQYSRRLGHDPSENCLTEAFAATLEAAPALALALAQQWSGVELPHDGNVSVTTQRRAAGLDHVDLELRVGTAVSPDVVVWVEVKLGSGLSGEDQLHRYERALVERWGKERTRLVFLTPNSVIVPDQDRPHGLVTDTWQRVGSFVRAEAEGLGAHDSYAFGVTWDFVDYLKELQLAEPDPFNPTHLVTLENAGGTQRLLEYVITEAHDDVIRRLSELGSAEGLLLSREPKGSWPTMWRSLRIPDDRDPEPARYYEWNLWHRPQLEGAIAFGAGVTVPLDRRLGPAARHLVLPPESELVASNDETWVRVYRFLRPAELLKEYTTADQIKALANWVLQVVRARWRGDIAPRLAVRQALRGRCSGAENSAVLPF